jgi:hypothetical protein
MRRFTTISEFHDFVQLPKPQHPLLSVVDVSTVPHRADEQDLRMVLDFYSISVKRMRNVQVKYGQHPFDFNEGIMSFMAPSQVFSMAVANPAEEFTSTPILSGIRRWPKPSSSTISGITRSRRPCFSPARRRRLF